MSERWRLRSRSTRRGRSPDLWRRPGLTPRDRSVVTVAVMIARNQAAGLAAQLERALENGVKPAEISEIITHLAFYSGWSNAMAAAGAAKDVLGDDVGQAVVDDELALDVGILGQELRELRPQDRVDGMIAGRDPDGAGGLVAEVAQSLELGLDLLEPRPPRCRADVRPPPSARRCAWCGSAGARRAAPRARGRCGSMPTAKRRAFRQPW
jgi:alkylhydroperoxidase/carboxymuconolactone decarboxylase family protein YurZ